MAGIQGTLTADFSSFSNAVEHAVVQLRGFEASTNKVESAMTRMTDNFSGRKIITEATLMQQAVENVGGVSHLTEAELAKVSATASEAAAKLRAMGQDVPPGLQKIADATKQNETATTGWSSALSAAGGVLAAFGIQATLSALVSFGKEVFADANELEKLADMTGISEEGLQRMRLAGNDADVTLQSMTSAVTMLQKRLGGDNESANRALLDFGINVAQFKQLDAAHQMAALSEAVNTTHDPLRVATDLSALFGRSWAEMLPVLKRGFKEVTDQATVMSSESVKALDDWGDAAGRFWIKTKGAFGEALADVLTLSLSDLRQLNSELKNLPSPPDGAKFANFWNAVVPPGVPADLDAITVKLDAQIKAQIKTTEAMAALQDVGDGWRGTLDTINGSVAEGIKYYLEAGVAQDKLATVYGLTAAQVKSVASELQNETAQLKLSAAATEEVTKLWDEFDQMASKGGSRFDDQVAAIDRWANDLEAKAQKAGTDTAGFYEALTALWAAKLHTASVAAQTAMTATSHIAIASFDDMNSSVMGIATSFDGWNAAVMRVSASLKALAAGNTLDVSHAAQDPEIMALLKAGWSLANAEAIKLGRQWGFTPKLYDAQGNPETTPSKGERVPGYLAGGPTGAGGLSMLDPGEYVVPKGGALVRGGGGVTFAPGSIVIQGSVLAEKELTTRLAAQITRSIQRLQQV